MKEFFVDEDVYVNIIFRFLDMIFIEKQISESIKMSYVDKGEIFKVFEEIEIFLLGNELEKIKKVIIRFLCLVIIIWGR